MVSNPELARKFVAGATSGSGSHTFIEGNAIYSYGYHFPIAIRNPDGSFTFNEDKYSVSTGKHKSNVRYAILDAGKSIIPSNTETLKKKLERVI